MGAVGRVMRVLALLTTNNLPLPISSVWRFVRRLDCCCSSVSSSSSKAPSVCAALEGAVSGPYTRVLSSSFVSAAAALGAAATRGPSFHLPGHLLPLRAARHAAEAPGGGGAGPEVWGGVPVAGSNGACKEKKRLREQ